MSGLPLVEEHCANDVFENAIRTYGVVTACEWFGHSSDSEFTMDTVEHLRKQSLRNVGRGDAD